MPSLNERRQRRYQKAKKKWEVKHSSKKKERTDCCYGCGEYKETYEYSKTQLKKGSRGKCKTCIYLQNNSHRHQNSFIDPKTISLLNSKTHQNLVNIFKNFHIPKKHLFQKSSIHFGNPQLVVYGFIRCIMDCIPSILMQICFEYFGNEGAYFDHIDYRLKTSNQGSTLTKVQMSSWLLSRAIVGRVIDGSKITITSWHFYLEECTENKHNIAFILLKKEDTKNRFQPCTGCSVGYNSNVFQRGDNVEIMLDVFETKFVCKINHHTPVLICDFRKCVDFMPWKYKYKLAVELFNPNDTISIKTITDYNRCDEALKC